MKKFEEMKKWLAEEESGQGMVEYGLIIVLTAVVVMTVLTTIDTSSEGKFEEIATAVSKWDCQSMIDLQLKLIPQNTISQHIHKL